MKKKKLLTLAVATAIAGTITIGVTRANTIVTPLEGEVVEYTLNGDSNTVFTAGILEISGEDTKIFILDRNLGATAAGTGCEDHNGVMCSGGDATYGYHFQWGNNYGFDPNTTPATGLQITTSISYNSSIQDYYTSSTFIQGSDNWLSNNSVVDLWGGGTDGSSNGWGANVTNPEDRQGPCPENFHVPSYGEWLNIVNMFDNNRIRVRNELLLPFAGFRRLKDASLRDLGNIVFLWSSSPYSAGYPYSRTLAIRMNNMDMYWYPRAHAYSVRCFKNSPYSTSDLLVSFWDENGENEIWSGEVESGNTLYTHADSGNLVENLSGHADTKLGYMLSGWYDSEADVWYDIDNPITTGLSFRAVWNKYYTIYFDENEGTEVLNQNVIENNTGIRPADPEKFKYTFSDWYDNPELEGEPFDFDNTVINGDITLYAKWERKEMVATLIYGPDFNSALKGLAGTDTWPDSLNNNIKYFEKTGQIPEGVTTRLISTTNSDLPVYARFDVTNGTIYYYTDADKIYAPESMRYMFNGLTVLKNLDLSEWDTSKTTSMRTLFQHCYELESVDMSGWNTSNVTDMSFMFNRCNSLKELDLKNFDTSKVTEMRAMFSECYELEELDLSNFDTSNVTNMKSMFMGVTTGMKLKSLNISSFDTKNVTNMNAMFNGCSNLTGLDLSNWDTSNVTDMSFMFNGCNNLKSLDLGTWNTKELRTMYVMFANCRNLEYLNLSGWDTSKVTNMAYTFTNNASLKILDLHSFDTRNVTTMLDIFGGNSNLETIYVSDKFIVSPGTDDNYMFIEEDEGIGCEKLVGGNGTKFDEGKFKSEYAKIDKMLQTGYFTDPNEITVNFISEGELYTGRIAVRSGQVEKPSENPSKSGLVFTNWYEDSGLNTIFDFNKGIVKYTELYAGFGEPQQVGGHSGGGGGSISRKDNCPDGDFSDSYYDGICGENSKDSSSQTPQNDEQTSHDDGGNNELQTAYEFAYENKITTKNTIEKADMEGNLTRIAMAKMLSKYAINVLGKKPANKVVPRFTDITEELNAEYDYGVSLAYQLGIMGINMPNNKFRPFDNVTRAEFVTALSRLLYDTEDGEILYYSTHMELLNKMGIISVTDPDMIELRGYVMLMLMRSAK